MVMAATLDEVVATFREVGGRHGWDPVGCYLAGRYLGEILEALVAGKRKGQAAGRLAEFKAACDVGGPSEAAGALEWLDRECPEFMRLVPADHRTLALIGVVNGLGIGRPGWAAHKVEAKLRARRRRNRKRAERRKRQVDSDGRQM